MTIRDLTKCKFITRKLQDSLIYESEYFHMDIVFLCLFHLVFIIARGSSNIFQFHSEKKTYEEAMNVCHAGMGNLSRFGEDVVNAAKKCQMQGFAWLAKPWIKNIGSYDITSDKLDQRIIKLTHTNIRLSLCATHCGDENYIYLGLTTSSCYCYRNTTYFSNRIINVAGSHTQCPGNIYDNCGVGTSQYIYQKVNGNQEIGIKIDKRYKQTFGLYQNHSRLHLNVGSTRLSFFCFIFKDHERYHQPDIDCGFNEIDIEQRTKTFLIPTGNVTPALVPTTYKNPNDNSESDFRVLMWTLIVVGVLVLCACTTILVKHRQFKACRLSCIQENRIYYAAPSQEGNEHAYAVPDPQYLEPVSITPSSEYSQVAPDTGSDRDVNYYTEVL